ncbi:MAG: acetolactate synthase small subunit [Flexistipes sinusarabici]|uniref:Acetolactate synthase small subunit n=1 Tax=Flexistipes sinusarabici TaxID=2352 RepID=A0A5D0MRT4_FLESI|nr:acetolactate synthase small subunit [Flexistipes sinusarabici]TYB34633.1 MAG: acetolactate synthase small subunit [Flexistipes sinusarabici]
MRHIISILVENKPGALSRIGGLFSGRGYNIESLSVGITGDPKISIMTIVTKGDDRVVEQIIKQLRKLINTIKVRDVTQVEHIEREMILVKVQALPKNRTDIFSIVNTFRAKVIDLTGDSMVIEITGTKDKNKAFLHVLEPFGIIEQVRTGSVAIGRGNKATTEFTKQDIKQED